MFEEILAKIAETFKKHHIPYMIIGGQAVLLYGEPRLTRDIDITLALSVDDLRLIINAADEMHLKILPENIESFVKQTMVLPAIELSSGIRVDFIFSYTPYEKEAISRAIQKKILGQEVCFSTVEDLIIHKIFAGRPRDIEDVKSVLIQNPNLDKKYVRRWLKEFDKTTRQKKFSMLFEKILKQIT